ncbi:putative bifunctional diguanylate cyclase/phosphodiesterase [Gymnodinialimonas ulvae]|uniref:putative bifunctional diguanylate cyclase/phosphodiesterase n=1 Tax=Gymnodinialimonas ulvae TaxID=3126504 RepID=UPI003098B89A
MVSAIRKLSAALRAALGFSELRGEHLTPDAAKRYRRDQIMETINQTQPLVLGNTIFAPILAYQAAEHGPKVLLIVWTIAMIIASLTQVLSADRLRKCTGRVVDLKRLELRALFLGAMWAIGFACTYPHVSGNEKVIVAIMLTGSVALGTFSYSRSAGAALIYLSATTLGMGLSALITGLNNGLGSDKMVAVLSLFAFATLTKSVVERGRANLDAFRNLEQLTEKTEVIELLVKDYEAQATEWVWHADADGRLIVGPDLIVELLGGPSALDGHEAVLHRVKRMISPESHAAHDRMAAAVCNRQDFHDVVLAFPDQNGDGLRWIAVKGTPQFDDGMFHGFRGIVADITKTVTAERRIQYLAEFDSLTGLLNRNSIQKKLGELDPTRDQMTAVLIDLDGFKQINDSYGHDTGDALLCAVADRLRVLENNGAWAARLSGDEFFMLLADDEETTADTRLTLGQEMCDRLSEPFQINEFELQISASVGMARFPADTATGHDLLSLCDLALYDAKHCGRNRLRLYDAALLEKLNWRTAVIERLRKAVRSGQIKPFYQSQHHLSDGRLIGFEALARWDDKELGPIGPDVFIPIAEQTGLIVDLGEQLLRMACIDAKRWSDQMGSAAPVISVNISPVQFARSDVAAMIDRALTETGLPPTLIEVEVTEGVLISDKSRVASTLQQLSAMGVSVALDDFGTGYSSLSYLKELPLNRLKIDRSFIAHLEDDPDSPFVSTVIQLGQNLGLSVIAEGVETKKQVRQLIDMGCDEGQGYHFNRPSPVTETDALIAKLVEVHAAGERKKAG